MQITEIARQRMIQQQIARQRFGQPSDVVRWMGAVQAQDYLGALWAVGLRTPSATEAIIERALADRAIIRTWPMRGTIHLVAADDVRWMLELLAPRAIQRSQGRLRQLGLDAPTLAASAEAVAQALEGGRQLTRPELYTVLEAAHIAAGGQRGLHILGHLSHKGLICFGARAGKQPTFALLNEWVPAAPSLPRDVALATLALRYFTGHGPATLQDLSWWAGITVAEARAGMQAAGHQLRHIDCGGQSYYAARDLPDAPDPQPGAFLLPSFDELLVAYRDRDAALDGDGMARVAPGRNGIFHPIMVIDGRVVGTWRRTIQRGCVSIDFSPFGPWDEAQAQAIQAAGERYGQFLGLPLTEGQR